MKTNIINRATKMPTETPSTSSTNAKNITRNSVENFQVKK